MDDQARQQMTCHFKLSLQSNVLPIVRHIALFFCAVCLAKPAKCCIEGTIWSDELFVGVLDHPKRIILLVLIHVICIYNNTCIAQKMGAQTQRRDVQTDTYNFTSSRKGDREQQQANDYRVHHCRNLHCLAAKYTHV